MRKADVGVSGFNDCAELVHSLNRWFRPVRKSGAELIINRQDFATQFRQPPWNKSGTGAVTAIDGNFQSAGLNGRVIERILQQFDMVLNWILLLYQRVDLIPFGLSKLSLVENVQELLGLHGVQVKTIATHKLQRVPLRRIVTGGNSDTAIGLKPVHRQLQTRCGANAEIDHLTTSSQQSCDDGRTDHWTRGSRIPADEYPAAVEISGKRLRKAGGHFRRECLADDATHTGNANL